MLSRISGILSILALAAALSALDAKADPSAPPPAPQHDAWDQQIFPTNVTFTDGVYNPPQNESPTLPGQDPRVPDGETKDGHMKDSALGIAPMPSWDLQGGYAATADDKGVNSGGGIGVVLFLDGGRTGIQVGAQVAGTQGGVFAYAQGDLKFRYRMPIDANHIFWGGFGLDIDGRGAVDAKSQSYLNVQLPVAFIGTMFNVGGKCVIQLFAKAAFGIYDNQAQAGKRWGANLDTMAKPAVGGEFLAACGSNIRVQADYEHVFDFGAAGDTDKARASFSQVFPVSADGGIQLGYFVKGEYEHEGGGPATGGQAANIGAFFGGLEVRFGAPASKGSLSKPPGYGK
ncbi:MAG: hypothetical protein HY075_00955 [Deltaproteobacteria bacterium]|nr:hypothetical protein [Deltaproteobacteria bacterium]